MAKIEEGAPVRVTPEEIEVRWDFTPIPGKIEENEEIGIAYVASGMKEAHRFNVPNKNFYQRGKFFRENCR